MKKRTVYLYLLLSHLFINACAADDKPITLESLLTEMIDYDAIAHYPEYACLQESSYDRRSIAPDVPGWWANDDGFGFIRTDVIEGRGEKVLFDQSGAGVITRIWITTQNKTGTLRFYFDGNSSPGWTVPAYDFVRFGIDMGEGLCQPHTSYSAAIHEKGGSTFFLPIPYANGCKITLEEPNPQSAPPRYYHVNYRKYPKGTSIETFSEEVARRAAQKIREVDAALLNPPTFAGGTKLTEKKTLSSKASLQLNLPKGKNAVRTISVSIEIDEPELYAQVMREIVFETEFDAKQTSWVPLSDFSGAGMGAPMVKSWYLDADGRGKVVSRWVMPYKDSGAVRLTNHSNETIRAEMTIHTAPFEWNDKTLYFHTSWKQELGIALSNNYDKGEDWNFALLKGKGVYAGDVLSLFNHSPRWYGEGDEKIWVDNDVFPSHFGTGTEDYYNSSWAPVVPFHTPFGGAPRADKASSHGYNTFFRTRNLDGIPFSEKLQFDIEMLSWDAGTVDYSTTAYWYGDFNSKAEGLSGIDEAMRPLLDAGVYTIPGCLEFEEIQVKEASPSFDISMQDMTPFPEGLWSEERHLLFKNGKTNDYVIFSFENLKRVKQRMVVYLTKANDFGILSFTINGEVSPVVFDGYNHSVVSSGAVNLGEYMPDEQGTLELKITLTGTNNNTQGLRYLIGLDAIQITEDVQNYQIENALEFEHLTPAAKSSNLTVKNQLMIDYDGGKWSNKNQMVCLDGRVNDYIEFHFDGLSAAPQNLTLYATKANDFGILAFSVNGTEISRRFDGYNPFVTHSGAIALGAFRPDSEGRITLRIEIKGANSKSTGQRYIFGLDCITIKEMQTATSLKQTKEGDNDIYVSNDFIMVDSVNIISRLSLFDLNGQLVRQNKHEKSMNVASLPKGVYLLEVIQGDDGRSVHKINVF